MQWRELEDQRFLCTPIRCSKSQRAVNQAVAIFVIVVVVLNHLLHPPRPQTTAQKIVISYLCYQWEAAGDDLDTPACAALQPGAGWSSPVSRAAVGRSETPRCHTVMMAFSSLHHPVLHF